MRSGLCRLALQVLTINGCLYLCQLTQAEEKDPAKPTEKPIVLKLVAVNGLALQHAAEDLWEDPEVVRTKDGLALEFAAEELQRDPRVEQNAFAKKHAAKELHADRDLKKDDTEEPRAVKQSRNASNHAAAEELRNDRDFILQVVKQDPDVLQLVSEELQCDKGVVIKALEGSIHALQHAAEKLQDFTLVPCLPKQIQSGSEAFRILLHTCWCAQLSPFLCRMRRLPQRYGRSCAVSSAFFVGTDTASSTNRESTV